MKKPAEITINLVPKDPFFETPIGRFLRWVLSAGRYIVIFTELVVIGSFITRFTLDRQITDLNSDILQKQQQIESYGTLEADFRLAQSRIEEYKQAAQDRNLVEVFPQLTAITPAAVQYTQLTITNNTINLSGTTLSQAAFSTLINNIQLSPLFSNVVISKIESPEENEPGYQFSISANTKEEKKVETKKDGEEETPEEALLE